MFCEVFRPNLGKVSFEFICEIIENTFVGWDLVLCQVARAFRFSTIKDLVKRGRFLVVLMEVGGDEQDHAVSCMDFVRKLTASSISLGDFRLMFRFILFSREDLKVIQSMVP